MMKRLMRDTEIKKASSMGKRLVSVLLSSALLFTSIDVQAFADELNNGKSFFYAGNYYDDIYEVIDEARDKDDKNIEVEVSGDLKLTKGIEIKSGEKVNIKAVDNNKEDGEEESEPKQKLVIDDGFNTKIDSTTNANFFSVEKDASLTMDGFELNGYDENDKGETVKTDLIGGKSAFYVKGDFSYINGKITGLNFSNNVFSVDGGKLCFTGSKIVDMYAERYALIFSKGTSYITGGCFEQINVRISNKKGGLVLGNDVLVMDSVETYSGHAHSGGYIRADRLYMKDCHIEGIDSAGNNGAVQIVGERKSKIYNSYISGSYQSWYTNSVKDGIACDVYVGNGEVSLYGVTLDKKRKDKELNKIHTFGINVISGKATFEKEGEYEDEFFGKIVTGRSVITRCDKGIVVGINGDVSATSLDLVGNSSSEGAGIYNEGYILLDDVSFKNNAAIKNTKNKVLNRVKFGDDIYNKGELVLNGNVHFENSSNLHILLAQDKYVTVKERLKYHNATNTCINIGFDDDFIGEGYEFVKYDGEEGLAYDAVESGLWNVLSVNDEEKNKIAADIDKIVLNSKICKLEIKVVNSKGKKVEGAIFKLSKKVDEDKYKEVAITKASNGDGLIEIEKLIHGDYKLDIYKLPEGYSEKNFNGKDFSLNEDKEIEVNIGRYNEAPIARISIDKDEDKINAFDVIKFSAKDSSDDTGIKKYSWDFGDGEKAEGLEVNHKYKDVGMRVVTLIVEDNDGKQSATYKELNIKGDGLVKITVNVKSTDEDSFIHNSYVYVTDENNEKILEKNTSSGKCDFYTEKGSRISISAVAKGYYSRQTSLMCEKDGTVTLYLSGRETIQGEVTTRELTREEMIEAGIDVDDEKNKQIVKYELKLSFYPIKDFSFLVNPLTCEVLDANFKGRSVDGKRDYIEPHIDKNRNVYLLFVHGTNMWVKDMFEVELLMINNSKVEVVKDAKANIELPKGLSLAEMVNDSNKKEQKLGDIDTEDSASALWYVRGDEDGAYKIEVNFDGKMHRKNQDNISEENEEIETDDYEFSNTFVTNEPVYVVMQSALGVLIELEETAATGQEYNVTFNYYNKSSKSIYNLTFDVDKEDQYSPGNESHLVGSLSVNKAFYDQEKTEEPLPVGKPIPENCVEELKPGEYVQARYSTVITFLDKDGDPVITKLCAYALEMLGGGTTSMDVTFRVHRTYKDEANYDEVERKNSIEIFGGDSVNLLTGAFESEFTDLHVSGYRDLDFKRYYNSQDGYDKDFGEGWSHNYDYGIDSYGLTLVSDERKNDSNDYVRENYINIRYPDGKTYLFERKVNELFDYDNEASQEEKFNGLHEGVYKNKEGLSLEVKKNNDKVVKIIMNDKGVVYTFNSKQKLVSIKDVEGFETKLSYDGGFLKEISNAVGKIEVSWNFVSNVISGVSFKKNDETVSVEYEYENRNLISEKNPNGDLMKFEYVECKGDKKENDDDSNGAIQEVRKVNGISVETISKKAKNLNKPGKLLKSITDYNGDVVVSNTYDDKRRVTTQKTGGKGTFTYDYDDEKRINVQTGFKNCKREIRYNENKQVISDSEKVGNVERCKTIYEYNSDGLPVYIIENSNDKNSNKRVIAYNNRQDIAEIIYSDKTSEYYIYDTSDSYLLLSTCDRNGIKTEYSYNDNNLLTEKKVYDNVDTKDAYKTSYTYDSSNRLLSESVDGNTLKTIKYYSDGRIKNIKDGEGFITSFSYDALGNVISSINPEGEETTYAYDYRGILKEETDAFGDSVKYTLDKNGKVTDIKDKRKNIESMKLNVAGNTTIYTSKLGNKTKYKYDDYGNLVKTTNPDDSNVNLSYDAYGNVISKTDENDNVWKYGYDKSNRLSEEINPEGLTVEYEYDVDGNVVSKKYLDNDGNLIEDANGNSCIEEYSYDKVGRLKAEKDRSGFWKKYEYDANGNLTVFIDENNIVTYNTYDENSNLIKLKIGDKTYSYVYDLNGNVTKETVTKVHVDGENVTTEKHVREYTYDFRGNVKSYVDEHNKKTMYEYDKIGNLIKTTYCDNTSVENTYDENSNLKTTKDRKGNVISFEYDKEDRLIKEVNGDREYGYSYDYAGRITEKTYPEGKKENFEYDSVGNLLTVTTNENIIKYTRDKLGRVLTESIEAVEGDDKKLEKYKNTYDILGNLIETDYTKTDGEYKDKIKYAYDANGRVVRKVDSNGNKYFYEYDGRGNVTKEKYNTGKVISYTYDVDNNVIEKCISYDGKLIKKSKKNSTSDNDGDSEGESDSDDQASLTNTNIVYKYDYDVYGNLYSYTDGCGNVTKYEYDDKNNKKKITDALGNYTEFTYDAFNNLKSRNSSGKMDESYDYDLNNNLIKYTDSNGNVTKYEYDRFNNLITRIEVNSNNNDNNRVTSYEYDNLDRCKKITYSDESTESFNYNYFDKVTSRKDSKNNETKYEYDYRGNLIKVTEPMGNAISYSYDCNDNLIEIIKNNGSLKYSYDGCNNLVSETDELGNKKEYSYDCFGNVLKEKNGVGSIDYLYDLNGNAISKTIITGKRVEDNLYTYDNNDKLIGLETYVDSEPKSIISIARDAVSNIKSVCDNGKTVEYGYDEDYNKTSMVYPNGDRVSYKYENNGNVKAIETPKNAYEFEYDSFDEVVSKKSNKVNEKLEYDNLGRLIKLYEGDDLREFLKYDTLGNIITKEEHGKKLNRITDYSYDKNGRLISETLKKDDEETTTKYQYDTNNNLVKETRGEKVVDYSYDEGDRLTSRVESVEESGNEEVSSTNKIKTVNYGYDKLGNLLSESTDDYNKTYDYNSDNRMIGSKISIDVKKNDGARKVDLSVTENIENTYAYNALGFVCGKTSKRETKYNYKQNPSGYSKVDIDSKSYLKNEQYLYDYVSDNPTVLSSEMSVSSMEDEDYTLEKNIAGIINYSKKRERTKIEKTYLINSNYVYNDDVKVSLTLNVNGETDTEINSEITILLGKPVVDEKSQNKPEDYSEEYALITDGNGSIVESVDSTGKEVSKVSYGSFGNIEEVSVDESDDILSEELKNSDILLSYTSYVYSDELKLLQDEKVNGYVDDNGYNKNTTWYAYERFYSTIDKRFLSKDPVVGSIYEPSRVNSYIYAGNNPLINVDRDGRSFACEITNGRYFKKAAELFGKISDVANKVGQVIEPVVEPIAKTVGAINDEFNKLPVGAKVAIGIAGAVVACVTGVGFTTVATTMAKSAIGGAVFGAATYGVESLITGKFDKTELVNNMLDGAADMFMISGVALGAVGLVKHARENGIFKLEHGEIDFSENKLINDLFERKNDNISISKSNYGEISENGNQNISKTEVMLPSKPHRNGTMGHWETILGEVDEMKQKGEYSKIYVNKGLSNEIFGAKPNRRPDIMGVRHNGLIDQVEVPSKTDSPKALIDRMRDNQRIMGDRAGKIKIKNIGGK